MSPSAAKFAIDKPTIEGVTEPGSKRGDPIEAQVNALKRYAKAVLYGRARDICFEAQYPLIDLVIEPDLTAAEKAAAPAAIAVGPTDAEMSAGIESGPVVEQGDWRRWRPVGRTAHRIGGVGYGGRRCEYSRGKTQRDQLARTHLRSPSRKSRYPHIKCATVAQKLWDRGE